MANFDPTNIEFIDSDNESDSNNITTIKDIEQTIQTFIKKTSFQNTKLIVEVIEMRNYNGLIFLKIGDQTGTIKAIIYKQTYKAVLKPGDKIEIGCDLYLYRSELELIIKSYKQQGTGALNAKLILLKKQLCQLGYFDNKPVLSSNYSDIGVISSLNAAGLKDFVHTINERCCGKKIYIYPSLVQGVLAPK